LNKNPTFLYQKRTKLFNICPNARVASHLQTYLLLNAENLYFAIKNFKRGDLKMKKFIWSFIIAALVIGLVPAMLPVEASAQSYYVRKVRDRRGRVRYVRVAKPSYYRRHRNRINMAIGTGGGALIGGLLGGGKGALIGAGVGAGSSALYTYKLNKKKRKYRKIRRY
jgi:hypothetical protein